MDKDDLQFMNTLSAKLVGITREVKMPIESQFILTGIAGAILATIEDHLNRYKTGAARG